MDKIVIIFLADVYKKAGNLKRYFDPTSVVTAKNACGQRNSYVYKSFLLPTCNLIGQRQKLKNMFTPITTVRFHGMNAYFQRCNNAFEMQAASS